MASLIARGGWGDREKAVMKRATVDDYLEAIRSLDGKEFKLFLLKNLDILEHGPAFDENFGDARHRLLKACRHQLQR